MAKTGSKLAGFCYFDAEFIHPFTLVYELLGDTNKFSAYYRVSLTDVHSPSDEHCGQPKSVRLGKTESYSHLIGPRIYSKVTASPLQADIP